MSTAPADPWAVSSWTPAELAAAGAQLGIPWTEWLRKSITPSIRCVLEAARAEFEQLGPVLLEAPRPTAAVLHGLAPAPWPLDNYDNRGRTLAVLGDDEPVARLDAAGRQYWFQLQAGLLDIAGSRRQQIPLRDGHGGPAIGQIVDLLTDGPVISAAIEWSRSARAAKLREQLEARAVELSMGVCTLGEREEAPRLTRPVRWMLGHVAVVERGAMRCAGELLGRQAGRFTGAEPLPVMAQ
jgi:hypothetical protein